MVKEGVNVSFNQNNDKSVNVLEKSIEECVIKKEPDEIEDEYDKMQEKTDFENFSGNNSENESIFFEYRDNFKVKNEESQQVQNVTQNYIMLPGKETSEINSIEVTPGL